ncbi:MAG: response regulator [Candidatus Methylacidiphilales bacterium]|nr:response regulator [Candidatus Methylacidiphilales bacterium]
MGASKPGELGRQQGSGAVAGAGSELSRRSTRALGFIVVVSFLELLLVLGAVWLSRHDAAHINMGGRQRMLSQRTAFFALQLSSAPDPSAYGQLLGKIREASDEMRSANGRLSGVSQGIWGSGRLKEVYQPGPGSLHDQVENYLSLAGQIGSFPYSERAAAQPLIEQLKAEAAGSLLTRLDQAVLLHQQAAESHWKQLVGLQIALFFLSLLAILSAGWFGIRPMTRQLERENRELLLAQEKQNEAVRQAEAASMAKSLFLANMSHEIRTPLNGIIGMAELLASTPQDSQQHEFTRSIRKSGETLLQLLNDILDFSKIESGHMDLERIEFSLEEVVGNSVDHVITRAAEKGVEMGYNIDPAVPLSLMGDPTRLGQILTNLIANAVKFTQKGEVSLKVTAPGPGWVRFEVRDSGIGISREEQARLFKTFSQVDASTTRKFGGTGLGLAICRRLCELMQGKIGVESELGRGSMFWFELPLGAGRSAVEDRTKVVHARLEGRRVFILDDQQVNGKILEMHLRNWGMECDIFLEPEEALARIRSGVSYDLGLVDYQMPGMDGLGFAHQVRKILDKDRLPMILISSVSDPGLIADDPVQPFQAVGHKPVHAPILRRLVVQVMAGSKRLRRITQTVSLKQVNLGREYPLRLLLAEDNPTNQKVALHLLKRLGYTADLAENGRMAVEMAGRGGYDLIFMDVQMPEMDGPEATAEIRRLPGIRQPRIVALTANAMKGDRERYLAAGMDDYLSKPVRLEDLEEALLRAVVPADPALAGQGREEAATGEELEVDVTQVDSLVDGLGPQFPVVLGELERAFAERIRTFQSLAATGQWAEARATAIELAGEIQPFGLRRLVEFLEAVGRFEEAPPPATLAEWGQSIALLFDRGLLVLKERARL